MPDNLGWAAAWAFLGAAVTGLFAWLTGRARARVDEGASVRAEWEKLNGALAERLGTVEKEFAAYRSQMAREIEDIRRAHGTEIEEIRRAHNREMDEIRKRHRAEMKAQRDLNEGLQRTIIQNSQSSAQLLGDEPGAARGRED
jgi:F0F1-type ATP synthase membrane subunit b/b'